MVNIALLQLNFKVGDLHANAQKIKDAVLRAESLGADFCVCSELAICGYPPRDLLLNKGFIKEVAQVLEGLALELKTSIPVLLGAPLVNASSSGRPLYNAAVWLREGEVKDVCHKKLLPSYDVFDEERYFETGDSSYEFEYKGIRFGVTICEDIWNQDPQGLPYRYHRNPVEDFDFDGIHCLLNLSASPFAIYKQKYRQILLSDLSKKHQVPIVYVNQVGGNDDLIFDGRSLAYRAGGELVARAKAFEEDVVIVNFEEAAQVSQEGLSTEQEAWQALVLGTRDYVRKCGFQKVVLGLSGGIDSAITAAIAADALGPQNVHGVLMPSPYSSQGSIDDSLALAKNLGIETTTLPIESIMKTYDVALEGVFGDASKNVAEENIQARIRGNLLMALSNKFGALLLTTGNKSELSVGYCTIYGDMSGGLAVISDVPKTLVFDLCRWVNAERGETIPQQIIDKPPSAELRPDQKDEDSLPPYSVLDEVLRLCIEQHKSRAEILEQGFSADVVDQVLKLVSIAEFKRKQAAPGLKVTDQAFGTGWRMPIASKRFL